MADDDRMKVMQQDIHMLKVMISEVIIYMKNAESEIPESYRRFVNTFHDLHDIRYMYHEEGMQCPEHVDREIERLHDRYRQILKKMNHEDGAFGKVRREMASDPENRYDHTKLLSKPTPNGGTT